MASFTEMQTIDMLQDGLTGSQKRHAAISHNMANVNTPGYKRREVSFKDALSEAYLGEEPPVQLHKAHPKHMTLETEPPVQPKVYQVDDTSIRNDKNNVDTDRQMAKLGKNSLYYNGLSQMMSQQFTRIGNLINDLQRP